MYSDNIEYRDNVLLSVVVTITFLGIVMIYSSSSILAGRLYDTTYTFLLKQSLGGIIGGIAGYLVFKYVNIYDLQNRMISTGLLLLSIFLLVLVLIIGKKVNGAKRWIDLYFVMLQPSEIAKLSLVIYVADFLSRKQKEINDGIRGLLPLLCIIGLELFLLRLEPDYGRMIILAMIICIMFIAGGMSLKYIFSILPVAGSVIGYLLMKDPIRVKRILDFWFGNIPYQLKEALRALNFGGYLGVGLGNSRQKFYYLPEAHSDFIFAIIGEELGIIGTSIIVLLFLIIVWRGVKIAIRANNLYLGLLATGIVSMIGLEAIINICVVMGILPTKGTTLPFISYGGSSIVVNLIAIGLLLNISKNTG